MGAVTTRTREHVVVPALPYTWNDRDYNVIHADGFQQAAKESVTSFRSGIQEDPNLNKVKNSDNLYDYLRSSDDAVRIAAPYDTGHEFDSTQWRIVVPKTQLSVVWRGYKSSIYAGPMVPRPWSDVSLDDYGMPNPDYDYLTKNQINQLGAKAIAKVIPTKPEASLAQALLELKDGLPHLLLGAIRAQKGRAVNSIGDEYLNLQFGWMPLISDVMKLLKAVLNFNEILDQYQRDSGRVVRRRYHYKTETGVLYQKTRREALSTYGNSYFSGYNPSGLFSDGAVATQSQTHSFSRKSWFSGAFQYYLEEGSDFLSKMEMYEQKANRLLGTRITPALLWELSPFSWLLDWWLDVGTFINNVTSFNQDGLVMRYGYMMVEETLISNYSYDDIRLYDRTVGGYVAQYRKIRKRRIRATPYGFGFDLGNLSESQWAILAALGMTRAPKTLR